MKKIILILVTIVAVVLLFNMKKIKSNSAFFQSSYEIVGIDNGTTPLGVIIFNVTEKKTYNVLKDIVVKMETSNGKYFSAKTNNRGMAIFIFYEQLNGKINLTVKDNSEIFEKYIEVGGGINFRTKRGSVYLNKSEVISFILNDKNNSISLQEFKDSGIGVESLDIVLERKRRRSDNDIEKSSNVKYENIPTNKIKKPFIKKESIKDRFYLKDKKRTPLSELEKVKISKHIYGYLVSCEKKDRNERGISYVYHKMKGFADIVILEWGSVYCRGNSPFSSITAIDISNINKIKTLNFVKNNENHKVLTISSEIGYKDIGLGTLTVDIYKTSKAMKLVTWHYKYDKDYPKKGFAGRIVAEKNNPWYKGQ